VAQAEWDRVAKTLHAIGVLTSIDRAALAACCQAYGRWVEAEAQIRKTPAMLKTPSGYVQQSPWKSVAEQEREATSMRTKEALAAARGAAGQPQRCGGTEAGWEGRCAAAGGPSRAAPTGTPRTCGRS
jgi:P27 family predicted phage terminase small subunit